MEWEDLVEGKTFITDLGEESGSTGNSAICRYAVWVPGNDMIGHRITEVNNDLQILQEKYHVPDELVMCVK